MGKKIIDFTGTKISDVKKINPLFSTCKVRVLYTGKNRNMSNISRDAVDKALPSIIGVPIVGEFAMDSKDFKGHGGKIDLDSYDFVHTTKPYGYVADDATFSWEDVKMKDGSIREYLVVDGCRLWTGRYPEAYSIVETGKGQSMEIEVTDGSWNDKEEFYDIKNFHFSALCILGDEVEPAFEDANITASFSMDSDIFKLEYAKMMQDVRTTLLQEEEKNMKLKDILAKYSITMEDLTAKGFKFEDVSEDELEEKIVDVMDLEPILLKPVDVVEPEHIKVSKKELDALEPELLKPVDVVEPEKVRVTKKKLEALEPELLAPKEDGVDISDVEDIEPKQVPEAPEVADVEPKVAPDGIEPEEAQTEQVANAQKDADDKSDDTVKATALDVESYENRIKALEVDYAELASLREYKLNIEKAENATKVEKIFTDFQLTEEDVEGLDVHKFSIEEIEEKAYAILGRKMQSKKFTKQPKEGNIRLQLSDESNQEEAKLPYGGLFEKYNK